GWRLNDPFEGARRFFSQYVNRRDDKPKTQMSQERMNLLLELVHRRITSQAGNTFVVHAPKKLIDNPSILKSDDIVSELSDSRFLVVMQDGSHLDLKLIELLFFVHKLISLSIEHQKIQRLMEAMGRDAPGVEVNLKMSIAEEYLLQPELAKVLLTKVKFEELPETPEPGEGDPTQPPQQTAQQP